MQKRVDPLSLAVRAADKHGVRIHQSSRADAGLVVRALRTIRAVLGTAAGLDAEQRAALDRLGIVILAVDGLGAEQQLGQRKVVERLDRSVVQS